MAEQAKRSGVYIDVNAVVVGGAVALLGLGLLGAFMWMVPKAAAGESKAACIGLRSQPPAPQACPGGQPCTLPVPAQDFTAIDHDGKQVKLSDYRGKVVLVNFWASWCNVCKTEKPALDAMAGDLSSDNFQVIALASDRSWIDVLYALVDALAPTYVMPEIGSNASDQEAMHDALQGYGQAMPDGIPFQVLLDPPAGDGNIGKIAASWGIKAVPESALIDRKGNLRAYFVNKRDWESPVAETCLRSLIDEE